MSLHLDEESTSGLVCRRHRLFKCSGCLVLEFKYYKKSAEDWHRAAIERAEKIEIIARRERLMGEYAQKLEAQLIEMRNAGAVANQRVAELQEEIRVLTHERDAARRGEKTTGA